MKDKIIKDIQNYFADTSRTKEETKDGLEDILDIVESHIDVLGDDGEG